VPAGADFQRRYTRSDPSGHFPRITGAPGIEANRMALYWRQLIDLTPTRRMPMRLAMIGPVAQWIADPQPGRVSWFSRIGVNGLRSQVVRHAGLHAYDAREPSDLPKELRTPVWQRLVDALDGFADLDAYTRALVVFHLAQLTFSYYARRLTGVVAPTGEPGHDHYAYQVARVHVRLPNHGAEAMPVFEALTANGHDPCLAVLSAAQGVGQAVRSLSDVPLAQRFEQAAVRPVAVAAGWHGHLARSRFHRAVALLRIAERQPAGMREQLRLAWEQHEAADAAAPTDEVNRSIVVENRRILIESEIKSTFRVDEEETHRRLRAFAEELERIDPYCVEALLVAGDGYAVAGDWAVAGRLYTRAGELGTGAGATGWYRAAQCYERLGDRDAAVNAMGRCLELDTTAKEPREYLTTLGVRT
jgi:tetratricopeptide (TPR) repeat protein